MRRLPNFVLLRAFEAAARLESFTLAAQELHLTPSAISHQIKELEAHFGLALFLRRNRRVELTPAATRLLDSLTRVFNALEAACAEVTLSPSQEVLAVHCSPSLAVKWLGPKLSDFTHACPGVTIRLTTGSEALDLNQIHEVDATISYGRALERPGVDVVSLGEEPTVPLCAPELLAGAVDIRRLLRESVLIDSPLSPLKWRDWFEANKLPLPERPRPSFDRAAMAISAAADGMGVVLESTRLAARELRRGELVEIRDASLVRFRRHTHFLSCRKNELGQKKVAAFRAWLLEKAAQD
ncbi:LysR family transcriptional regulator [Bordetella genomosp. 10]|uniref:LysR family transcriptional regulator n=1 Tax=Bordetella genomosp. 10 TaxID=1416804 RepID=A0A261S5Z6_9BORD|nr:LysR substrate-binding domain-containing protein [Bordetella genomosp. 10]OZI31853.1 LysR family transcriptional regulator [Bordetella genomosp. 10]